MNLRPGIVAKDIIQVGGRLINILCSELEVAGGSDEQYLDVSGAPINYASLGLELDDDENEIESIGAINRSKHQTKPNGIKFSVNI